MANLVQPVAPLEPIEERIIDFKGLNRKRVVSEGEMSDMWNMTSDNYPLLTPRKPRGAMRLPRGVVRPVQLMAKFEKIAMIAQTATGTAFYYDGVKIDEVDDISDQTRMVAINTKICFFPENKYIEVTSEEIKPETYGSLEAEVNASAAAVTISMEDTRIVLPSGHGLAYDDAINIEGTLSYGGGSHTVDCNVSVIVEEVVNNNTIVIPQGTFLELIGSGVTSASFTGTVSRTMPTLDHVVEWNNRLWGCCNEDNTVYASKLGDPKNWQYFQGTSVDSYYAQQGTDGVWTGIGLYSNHIIFFKQDSMCRVYGTAPSNYQVTNAEVFGVESGSRQSVVTINDTVFYKSKIGIMAYSGDIPVCISDKFNVEFKDVVSGTEKRKYYASIHKKGGGYELMVFDVDKGTWHKEDGTKFRSCATIGDKLYYVEYEAELLLCSEDVICSDWLVVGSGDTTGHVRIINPVLADEDATTMEWRVEFGPFDEYIEEHKIYSKLAMRIIADETTDDNVLCDEDYEPIITDEDEELEIERYLKVYISIDEGDWELVGNHTLTKTKGDFIPIIPRRCDRYSVKVEGKGYYEIKSLTRRVRKGSFGRL